MIHWFIILCCICVASASSGATSVLSFHRVYVDLGQNLGQHVQNRIMTLLSKVSGLIDLYHLQSIDSLLMDTSIIPRDNMNTLIISFGNTTFSSKYITTNDMAALRPESFKINVQRESNIGQNVFVMAANGLPLDDHVHKNISFDRLSAHYGAILSAYAGLEQLGFSFLHPLEPYVPPLLRMTWNLTDPTHSLDITESPYWPERGFHIHTQHPLELTEVLQGHDIPQFGPHGTNCHVFNKRTTPRPSELPSGPYCERWEDMVGDVDLFFEWAIANRLNKVEWLLLENYKWGDELSVRHDRLRKLTSLGHQYSLLIGADVPLGNIQQHGWYIVNVRLPFKDQEQQIRDRVDWIFQAGFDFLTTESGMSEFTHPECGLMVDLMNAFAMYVNGTWGREAAIKVHCSTGQKCSEFPDPRTGDPMNFNFLPTFTHPSMGIFPHTVQVYALDDPTGGSYGNANFSYIEDYLVYEAKQGKRAVSFYGETAYWVNVDIDVPLFLPIYGQRRQRDLRRLASRELAEGFRMDGQMNFDSGWEWGYWISDVITARSSWNPMIQGTDASAAKCKGSNDPEPSSDLPRTCPSHSAPNPVAEEYYRSNPLLDEDQWRVFSESLQPITGIFGASIGGQLNQLLVDLSRRQAELLIFGMVDGKPSDDLKKVSGIAYLSGTDTWVDLPRKFGLAFTQPDKVHLKENSDPRWPKVMALLREMETTFHTMAHRGKLLLEEAHQSFVATHALPVEDNHFTLNQQAINLLHEVVDCIEVLYLRARQVHLLYQSRDQILQGDTARQRELHLRAREVLQEAAVVVQRRESHYRVSWQRVAGWRENPTVYRYGYLWSVHKLYYWWRDQGLAEQASSQSEHSPCYLNRMDSTEVAVGWGKYTLELLRTFINRYTPFHSFYPLEIFNCLSPPPREYDFPRDLSSVHH